MGNTMNLDLLVLCDYGATDDLSLALWMQSDGTLVNGSNDGCSRDCGYAGMVRYYPGMTEDEAVQAYMRHGAVRMDCSEGNISFEFIAPLFRQQKKALSALAWRAAAEKRGFTAVRHNRKSTKAYGDAMAFLGYLSSYCHFEPVPPDDLKGRLEEILGTTEGEPWKNKRTPM